MSVGNDLIERCTMLEQRSNPEIARLRAELSELQAKFERLEAECQSHPDFERCDYCGELKTKLKESSIGVKFCEECE